MTDSQLSALEYMPRSRLQIEFDTISVAKARAAQDTPLQLVLKLINEVRSVTMLTLIQIIRC